MREKWKKKNVGEIVLGRSIKWFCTKWIVFQNKNSLSIMAELESQTTEKLVKNFYAKFQFYSFWIISLTHQDHDDIDEDDEDPLNSPHKVVPTVHQTTTSGFQKYIY